MWGGEFSLENTDLGRKKENPRMDERTASEQKGSGAGRVAACGESCLENVVQEKLDLNRSSNPDLWGRQGEHAAVSRAAERPWTPGHGQLG